VKVLLIQPPIEDFYDTSIRTYPLGLLYIATRVAEIADVSILDARTGRSQRLKESPFPELEPYYQKDVFTPFSFFSDYKRFGLNAAEIGQAIGTVNPEVIGISAMCSAYEQQALEVARIAHEVNRNVVTVMGGIHATLFPERLLSSPHIDYCIRGEGETPFYRLTEMLYGRSNEEAKDIEGVCYKEDGQQHISEINIEKEIDITPDRSLLSAGRYRIGKRKYAFLLTSRGCPFGCEFCGKPPAPFRKRSLTSIENEIDECIRFGIEAIDFEDDMLNLDKRSFDDLCRMLAGKELTLSAMNGIYPGTIDVPALRLMHQAGFGRLNFSLVDVSSSVLANQKRKVHHAFLDLLPYLEMSPFLVEVHFIIGLPGQSPADLIDTMVFLMSRKLLLGPSIFYIAPGSPIFQQYQREGNTVPLKYMRSSSMLPINPMFPRTLTFTAVKLARFINFVKDLIDREPGITRLSDMFNCGRIAQDPKAERIIESFLTEKKLICYDLNLENFTEEPHDCDFIRAFFEKARGCRIRGFKTTGSVIVDV
jgi:anaerobic magnesium-protoporphyrin IX monomethyl ester cyclase